MLKFQSSRPRIDILVPFSKGPSTLPTTNHQPREQYPTSATVPPAHTQLHRITSRCPTDATAPHLPPPSQHPNPEILHITHQGCTATETPYQPKHETAPQPPHSNPAPPQNKLAVENQNQNHCRLFLANSPALSSSLGFCTRSDSLGTKNH